MSQAKIGSLEAEDLYITDTSATRLDFSTIFCHSTWTYECWTVFILLDIETKECASLLCLVDEVELSHRASTKRSSITESEIVIITNDAPISIFISEIIVSVAIIVHKLGEVLSITLRGSRKILTCSSTHSFCAVIEVCETATCSHSYSFF